MLSSIPMSFRRALLVFALIAAGCGGKARIDPRQPVILISIDTLRSDHLPAYGYSRIATPAIDKFRSDSILYERAYSNCPLTLVSHASIFTGLLPAEHGIRDNLGYTLNPNVKTIAELMKSKGYATGAAVSAIVLRGESQIKRGFDFWDDDVDVDPNFLSMGRAQRKGDETRVIAQKWIGEHKSQPFFFFFHIYEPHTPYEPTYDADVVTADAVIGRFLGFLRDEGIYDRATIILLSDHGEGLGDHGEDEHGILLYRETLQVPLMLKLPHAADGGKSVSAPVELIDVFPTLADAFGIAAKSDGTSLLATFDGKAAADRKLYAETYYPRFHFGWSDMHSLISGFNHYIQSPKSELFDLAGDPGERKNVLLENRRAYVALREAIAPFIKGAEAPKAIDPEQAKQLAALGYVGSTATTSGGVELPDPKDHISTSGAIKQAFLAFQQHRYDDTVKDCTALLRDNPNMVDIWSIDAQSLAKLGRYDDSIAAAQEGLKRAPTNTAFAIMIANIALEQKMLDMAEKHARLIATDAPNESHNLLGQVYLLRKDYPHAEQEANAWLGENRDRPFALMLLGRVAMEQGKLDDALRIFDQALAINDQKGRPPVQRLNYFRGDDLARMGRAEDAEAAFRKEVELFPTDPQPYKNLLLLYVVEGKNSEATQLIFSLEKASPTPPSYAAISETLKTIGDNNGARYWAARGLQRFPGDRHLQALLRG
jgi:arylsulfatase A-like enzyme/Flp pilus assembly protein TadD